MRHFEAAGEAGQVEGAEAGSFGEVGESDGAGEGNGLGNAEVRDCEEGRSKSAILEDVKDTFLRRKYIVHSFDPKELERACSSLYNLRWFDIIFFLAVGSTR